MKFFLLSQQLFIFLSCNCHQAKRFPIASTPGALRLFFLAISISKIMPILMVLSPQISLSLSVFITVSFLCGPLPQEDLWFDFQTFRLYLSLSTLAPSSQEINNFKKRKKKGMRMSDAHVCVTSSLECWLLNVWLPWYPEPKHLNSHFVLGFLGHYWETTKT